jgi:UPF0716 protein FxsA
VILLALLLYAVAEVAAFVVVAEHVGILLAVILVLGISAAGPALVRRAGTGVVNHARERIRRGETPDREVLDGVVLLLGGVLVCIPGFIGDAVGLLLLLGPVRHAVIRLIGRHLGRRVASASMWSVSAPGFGRRGRVGDTIVDATAHEPGGHPGHGDDQPPALDR